MSKKREYDFEMREMTGAVQRDLLKRMIQKKNEAKKLYRIDNYLNDKFNEDIKKEIFSKLKKEETPKGMRALYQKDKEELKKTLRRDVDTIKEMLEGDYETHKNLVDDYIDQLLHFSKPKTSISERLKRFVGNKETNKLIKIRENMTRDMTQQLELIREEVKTELPTPRQIRIRNRMREALERGRMEGVSHTRTGGGGGEQGIIEEDEDEA